MKLLSVHSKSWIAFAIDKDSRETNYIFHKILKMLFENCLLHIVMTRNFNFIIFEQSKGQKLCHKTYIRQMHQILTSMFLKHTLQTWDKNSQDEKFLS